MALDQKLLDSLLAINQQNGATWQAGPTSMLHLSEAERLARLGYVPGPGEPSLQEREATAAGAQRARATTGARPSHPPIWDWRHAGGNNYISPIKDQGSCGSCVAFGTVATLEGTARVVRNTPLNSANGDALHNLSEAQLFYCGGGQDGRTCRTGWWVDAALNYACSTGIAPASYFRYEAGEQACHLATGWQSKLTTPDQTGYLTASAEMKQWLSTRGPLISCFSVYADFDAYTGGVYRYNGSAPFRGGHCISVIGYDDARQAWLCKNSWGTNWGMGGYFYIGYGQCGIDAGMWSIKSFSRIDFEAPTGIRQALGMTNGKGMEPYAFVQAADGNVWGDRWNGKAWTWTNHGQPADATITGAIGATTVSVGRPYLFVQGSDGNLWVNWWTGSAWSWSNQGKPGQADIAASAGAVAVSDGPPYAFVQGSDGNLWVNTWDGSVWSWTDLGKPGGTAMAGAIGATVVGHGPYVFVQGGDGKLWLNWWTGSAWSWSNQGLPPGVGIAHGVGVTTVDGGKPFAFIHGNDGNLWLHHWDGTAWHWRNQGQPGDVGIANAVGAITVDGGRAYAFVQGGDGNLWVNWWTGSTWSWGNQGKPAGVEFASPAGAINVADGRPYVFLTGSDGNLWSNWWDGKEWHWTNQGGAA